MRRRKALTSLLGFLLVAVLALGWTLHAGNEPLLGLDLQGGVSVILTPKNPVDDDDRYEQAITIMNQRINSLGVAEPDIHREGPNIVVQIAGVKDRDKAIDLVGEVAELRFRPVLAVLGPDTNAATPGTTVPGTTPPGSVVPATTGTTPAPAAATATTEPAAVNTTPSTTAAPATQQNGLGIAPGENAAGPAGPVVAQTPTTVTDQAPTTVAVAPTASTPTASTPTASTPTASTPTVSTPAAQTPTSQQIQSALAQSQPTTKPEDDKADATVVLPDAQHPELERYQLGPTALTGSALEGATASLDTQTGQWVVNPKFKAGADGIDKFNAIAGQCHSKAATCPTGQLAITLDSKVISAPSINAASFSADQIQISGSFNEDSAHALATGLKYGALPIELVRLSTQEVSATLGLDSLHAGLLAGLVGLILVTIYMVAFYRLLGVLAILKLAIEGAILWAIISFLGSTVGLALTLAGVTGIIVSIGVSLDSNVVYYEHLREDIRAGRTVRSAVDKSFASAFSTILKADGASLLGASLLYWLAVGPVRGFAFYLGLSTLLDIISSYFYMRPVVFLATSSAFSRKNPGWFGLPHSAEIDEPVVVASRPSKSKGKATTVRPAPTKKAAASSNGATKSAAADAHAGADADADDLIVDAVFDDATDATHATDVTDATEVEPPGDPGEPATDGAAVLPTRSNRSGDASGTTDDVDPANTGAN